mgnify:CR=1 FL=1
MFPVSDSVFQWYDLGATFFWGMSGAMLAARKGCDIVGIFIIAMVSATGGGLIRDGLFLPGWAFNVATIVHSDEALLATGFIFTVHFFNTHGRPEKFPMDPVIFTGRLTEPMLDAVFARARAIIEA